MKTLGRALQRLSVTTRHASSRCFRVHLCLSCFVLSHLSCPLPSYTPAWIMRAPAASLSPPDLENLPAVESTDPFDQIAVAPSPGNKVLCVGHECKVIVRQALRSCRGIKALITKVLQQFRAVLKTATSVYCSMPTEVVGASNDNNPWRGDLIVK